MLCCVQVVQLVEVLIDLQGDLFEEAAWEGGLRQGARGEELPAAGPLAEEEEAAEVSPQRV